MVLKKLSDFIDTFTVSELEDATTNQKYGQGNTKKMDREMKIVEGTEKKLQPLIKTHTSPR